MALLYSRPKPNSALVGADGRITPEWFNYLSGLDGVSGDTTGLQSQINALQAEINALPSGPNLLLLGPQSVQVDGSSAFGYTLQLVNDSVTPGPDRYYGTDGAGAKGFHTMPTGTGIMPMVTGEVPPVLLYQEDGSLVYYEV